MKFTELYMANNDWGPTTVLRCTIRDGRETYSITVSSYFIDTMFGEYLVSDFSGTEVNLYR